MKIEEILEQISELNYEELKRLQNAVIVRMKGERNNEATKLLATLKIGDKVRLDRGGKFLWNGTIEKINQTRAKVKKEDTNVVYSVPASMLTKRIVEV